MTATLLSLAPRTLGRADALLIGTAVSPMRPLLLHVTCRRRLVGLAAGGPQSRSLAPLRPCPLRLPLRLPLHLPFGFALRLPLRVRHRCDRSGEIRARQRGDPLAELLAQSPRSHLLDRAFGEFAELERTERHPDQAVHGQPQMAEHVLHLAVLAFAHGEGEPHIRALHAIDGGVDRPVAHAVDADARPQRVEPILRHLAVRAHAVAPQPAGRRQFEHAREPAIVGQEQQPLGIEVEPPDADEARQTLGQRREDGLPAGGIDVAGQEPARLVIEKEPRALALRQRHAINGDVIRGRDVERGRGDHLAIDRDPSGGDPALDRAAGREPGARDHLGYPLT